MELISASNNGDYDRVRYLVENGVDVNFKNEVGSTALIYACERGFENIVRYLVEYGANINDDNHWCSLHSVATTDNLDILKYLISYDENGEHVNINCVSTLGDTPLHIASFYNRYEIVKFLLENGADPFIKNKDNIYAHELTNHDRIFSLILEYQEPPDVKGVF